MALRVRRAGTNGLEVWPGYVDALSTLLMVVMFVLLVFVLAQALESVVLAKRNDELTATNQNLTQERERNTRLNQNLAAGDAARQALLSQLRDLDTQTANTMAERDKLAALLREVETAATAAQLMNRTLTTKVETQSERADAAEARLRDMQRADGRPGQDRANRQGDDRREAVGTGPADRADARADRVARRAGGSGEIRRRQCADRAAETPGGRVVVQNEKKLGDSAQARIAALTQQVEQLTRELGVSEQQRGEAQAKANGLEGQLNLALAAQVEELRKYRSDFFGKLREVLAGRPGISIVGDRFVLQSDVSFAVSSAELTPAGIAQLTDIAAAFRAIIAKIPPDVNWVLRIDGHTDKTPIHNARFASNWELSAARAITVVKFLITQGIPAEHLAATGFGENQPVDPADTPEAYAKNRRIEIRLTDR